MKRLHFIWFYLLLALTIYGVVANLEELQHVVELIPTIGPLWLLVALVCELLTYTMAAINYQHILRSLGHRIRLWPLHQIYIALTFVYHALPFSGVVGAVYLTGRFEALGIPKGKGLSAAILSTFCSYLSFVFLLLLSIIYFIVIGAQDSIPYIEFLLVLIGMLVLFFGVDQLVVRRTWLHARLSKFLQRKPRPQFLKRWSDDLETYLDEMAFARDTFKKDWKLSNIPTLAHFGIFVFDAISLYGLLLGLHIDIGFFPILLSVGLARFFSTISLLPGGVGQYEVAQVVALHAFGLGIPEATVITLVFRLFSYWLPIPLGIYFYRYLDSKKT